MNNLNKESSSSKYAMAFARPFALRGEMTPVEFSNTLMDIREAVINKQMSLGEAKVALLSLQIQLNHAALEIEYMQLDQEKKLVWRMPVLDRSAQPKQIEPEGNIQ
jgi:hypothetical protein